MPAWSCWSRLPPAGGCASASRCRISSAAPIDPFARQFVFFFALAPVLAATIVAVIVGERTPIGGIAPHVVLSGLAVVVAAGADHRRSSPAHCRLRLGAAAGDAAGDRDRRDPAAAVDRRRRAQGRAAGQRHGPVSSPRASSAAPASRWRSSPAIRSSPPLVAVGAPARPSVYDYARPDRTPWVDDAEIIAQGRDRRVDGDRHRRRAAADIRARFPDLVPANVPRAFERI